MNDVPTACADCVKLQQELAEVRCRLEESEAYAKQMEERSEEYRKQLVFLTTGRSLHD